MATNQFLLYENAMGYALFEKTEAETVAQDSENAQQAMADYAQFSKMCKLVAFQRFISSEMALEQCNAVAAGEASQMLIDFLELNLPKKKKKSAYTLGVYEPTLGSALQTAGFVCNHGQNVRELLRGCLMHFVKFEKELSETDFNHAIVGLSHSYSGHKMQLDPNRQDKPIMNLIAVLDALDKNINMFAMRVKEWYAWHFPEMTKIVTDNIVYAKVCQLIRLRDKFDFEGRKAELLACVDGNEELYNEIVKAANNSMGQEIVEMDMINIDNFASQVVAEAEMRRIYTEALRRKMDIVAPNLRALIGEFVGARLISHAGSLTNLCKYPASTVQILGAEKALFRALKTKGNTPKYGLLFHSSFIGRAQQKNKGRISRYLANKCSIASRIDHFSEYSTNIYGERMKEQVEDRLAFLTEGTKPRKNADVMKEAMAAVEEERVTAKKNKKQSKKASKLESTEAADVPEDGEKKKKKKKKSAEAEAEDAPPAKKQKTEDAAEGEKKKKKKKKSAE